MKTAITTFLFTIVLCSKLFAQTPPVVYINFVSHNEPNDNLHTSINYLDMKTKVLELASIIDSKGAAWNLQTCDGFARGAVNNETNPTVSNVFKTLTSGSYSDNIEIDPRPKTTNASLYNIADTWNYLNTLGCNPTHTVGGFVYSTQDATTQPIDWWVFQDEITSKSLPLTKWKASIMWGAGSYKPHTNDLNDYGIWKPDAVSYTSTLESFYKHNPNNTVWYIGNGCQPIQSLDADKNIDDILIPLKDFVDNVQNKTLPQNKFYVYSVTINQREFGSVLFQKISDFCDVINSWGTSKIQWKKLSEKFSLFQSWQSTTGLEYSQWNCGTSPTLGVSKNEYNNNTIYPNPSNGIYYMEFSDNQSHSIEVFDVLGHLILKKEIQSKDKIDMNQHNKGIYLLRIDNKEIKKIIID